MKAQGVKAIESAGNRPLRAVTGSLPRAGSITGGCLQHDIFMHSGEKKKKRLVFRARASRLPAFALGHDAECCSH